MLPGNALVAGVTDPGYKSHPVAAEVWLLGFEMS